MTVKFTSRGIASSKRSMWFLQPILRFRFQLRCGRVKLLGLQGLVGAGRTELLQTFFGVTPSLGGELEVQGVSFSPRSPADAVHAGLALAPEDRKQHGLVLPMTVRENASLPSLERDQKMGFLDHSKEREIADVAVEQMKIKTPSIEQPARFLSGGNQQKIVLGKWFAMNPKLLMLDEPTRGIDIGAKREIYKLMEKACRQRDRNSFCFQRNGRGLGNGRPGLCDARRKNFGRTSKESNV